MLDNEVKVRSNNAIEAVDRVLIVVTSYLDLRL